MKRVLGGGATCCGEPTGCEVQCDLSTPAEECCPEPTALDDEDELFEDDEEEDE